MKFNFDKLASINLPEERRDSNNNNLSDFRKNSLINTKEEKFNIKSDIDLSKPQSENLDEIINKKKEVDFETETRERKNCSLKSSVSGNNRSLIYKALYSIIKGISSKIDLNINSNNNIISNASNSNNDSNTNEIILNEFITAIYEFIVKMTSLSNILILICLIIGYFFMFNHIFSSICLLITMYEGYKSQNEKRKDYVRLMLLFLLINYLLDLIESICYVLIEYVPFYYFLKLIITLWMLYPSLRGLNYLYSLILYKILNNTDETESITFKVEEYFKLYDKKYSSIVGS